MNIWTILVYGAWLIAALIFLWMIVDALKVGSEYSEELLTSSREGQE